MKLPLLVHTSLIFCASETVVATFSIAAADHKTKQVGAAGGTCKPTGGYPASWLYGSVPGRGAFCAQFKNDELEPFDEIRARLNTGKHGETPEEIMTFITESDEALNDWVWDPSHRQYGIVSLKKGKKNEPEGWTGNNVWNYKDDVQGKAKNDFSYAVQGNTLTGPEVIDNMELEFKRKRRGKGPEKECDDLAQRLFDAILSHKDDEGDSRCTTDGFPANTYFIHIDNPGGPPNPSCGYPCGGAKDAYLHISVDPRSGEDGRTKFVTEFNKWREEHECLKRRGPGLLNMGIALSFVVAAIASVGFLLGKKRRRISLIDISDRTDDFVAAKEGAAKTELSSTATYVMDYSVTSQERDMF